MDCLAFKEGKFNSIICNLVKKILKQHLNITKLLNL
jgi:hypothetical protein